MPFAPDAGPSALVRAVSEKMSELLGQPIILENRPGAGSTVGARAVARSNPDGYTLLQATNATLVTAPKLYRNAGYDPRKDFSPFGLLGMAQSVLVVHPATPANSISELIALSRRSEKQIVYGSPGVGTPNHLSAELFAAMAGIKLAHVPYRGPGPAVADLVSGHIQMMFATIPNVHGHAASGRLRALGVTSATRATLMPNIPTIAESGLDGFDTAVKIYLVAPAGTPRVIVQKLSATLRAVLLNEDLRRRFAAAGTEPLISTPAEVAEDLDREEIKWSRVVKSIGLVPEN